VFAPCCHEALTLDGLVASYRPAQRTGQKCLHALSSFQRTKDLVFRSPRTRHPFCWILLRPFLGEPFKLTTTSPSLSTNISHFGENPLVTCPAARCPRPRTSRKSRLPNVGDALSLVNPYVILTIRRSRWPFLSTITRPPIASSTETAERSSVSRRSFT